MLELTDSGSRDTTSEVKYALCACSYLGAMVSSNTALQYVNYPTQVLGKSCKPIPVMLLGRFTENLALTFESHGHMARHMNLMAMWVLFPK